jgi:hypothetical protein
MDYFTIGFVFLLIGDIFFGIYRDPYAEGIKPYAYIDLFYVIQYLVLTYAVFDNARSINKMNEKIKSELTTKEQIKK